MKKIMFLFLLVLLISSCTTNKKGEEDMSIQSLTFSTSDKYQISAKLYKADSDVGVILLHQLGRDKSTYDSFAKEIQKNNINALAIDLRGHGASSGSLGTFSDRDFNNMILDVSSSKAYLESIGITNIFVVGASIGANTALNFVVTNPDLKGVVLLSPGLDYRGIKTQEDAKKIKVPTLIIVSRQDSYAFDSSNTLYSLITSDKQIKVYDGTQHGTDMFLSTDMDKVIIEWILDHS